VHEGVYGTASPLVRRKGKEEGSDGGDDLGGIDILDDHHGGEALTDVIEGGVEIGKGFGVTGVGTVVVPLGERLTGRTGEKVIASWGGGGVGGEGVIKDRGGEKAAAGPGVRHKGTRAVVTLGGMEVVPLPRKEHVACDRVEIDASESGCHADAMAEATEAIQCTRMLKDGSDGEWMSGCTEGGDGLTRSEVRQVESTPQWGCGGYGEGSGNLTDRKEAARVHMDVVIGRAANGSGKEEWMDQRRTQGRRRCAPGGATLILDAAGSSLETDGAGA
jgi:hypothetical protein